MFTKGSGEVLKVGRSPVFVREIWNIKQKNLTFPKVYTSYIWFLSKSTSLFNTYTIYSGYSLTIQVLIFFVDLDN